MFLRTDSYRQPLESAGPEAECCFYIAADNNNYQRARRPIGPFRSGTRHWMAELEMNGHTVLEVLFINLLRETVTHTKAVTPIIHSHNHQPALGIYGLAAYLQMPALHVWLKKHMAW